MADEEDEIPDVANEIESEEELILTEVTDEEVPLANNLVEDVKHCVMHFFEWILAAILAGYYVVSTKKQKKEIAELRSELEHEDK